MAIRTTIAAVRGILELDDEIIAEDSDLDPFIETANNIVDQVCLDSGYSDATLELIERWLSAHFYCIRDPRSAMEQVKGLQVTYQGRTYTGLRHTSYGQQAMLIDTAGNLKILDDNKKFRIKASIKYIGETTATRILKGLE